MRSQQPIEYASLSDVGLRRTNNEDACRAQVCADAESFRDHGHVFVVADGMGGHAVGELASKLAVDTVPHTYAKARGVSPSEALRIALEQANRVIHHRGKSNPEFRDMGTTCSALVLCPAGAVIAHVGDSRVYRIRSRRIDQLTFDHSLQWELQRRRTSPPEEVFLYEPRSVITRSLGPRADVDVDVEGPFPVLPCDRFVLCSDGLSNLVSDEEIGIVAGELPPAEACRLLVNLANLRGGTDNVTAVVVSVGACPDGAEYQPETPPPARVPWAWFVGYLAAAALFSLGVCLALLGAWDTGSAFAVAGVATAVALLVSGWRRRERRTAGTLRDDTVVWRPYRTASARLDHGLLRKVAALEAHLQQSVREEGCDVDWAGHERAWQQARSALQERQASEALRAYGRAIDVLMSGFHTRQRQNHGQVPHPPRRPQKADPASRSP